MDDEHLLNFFYLLKVVRTSQSHENTHNQFIYLFFFSVCRLYQSNAKILYAVRCACVSQIHILFYYNHLMMAVYKFYFISLVRCLFFRFFVHSIQFGFHLNLNSLRLCSVLQASSLSCCTKII